MATVAFVKGEKPTWDRVWLTQEDGVTSQVAVHVIHDLPHLVVESLFGISDGLWGTLARGGFANANRTLGFRDSKRARLVTDLPFDNLAEESWLGHVVAKAATNAVTNRWNVEDGPNHVRQRLAASPIPRSVDSFEFTTRVMELIRGLDDSRIALAETSVRVLLRRWVALSPGEILSIDWPVSPEVMQSLLTEETS